MKHRKKKQKKKEKKAQAAYKTISVTHVENFFKNLHKRKQLH